MADNEQALQLKRRARRRLVGAIALVTFVVIILPLLLDKEPAPSGTPLSVQIPKQDSGSFNTRVAPPAAPVQAVSPVENKAEDPAARADAPAPKAESPAAKQDTPQQPASAKAGAIGAAGKIAATPSDKAEQARAEAMLNDQAWVVAVGSYSSADNVKELQAKLSAAGLRSYTEQLKTGMGEQTRVRAGPFSSKEAADKAREQIAAMGLKPGSVTSR